jgi:hypothetical protein
VRIEQGQVKRSLLNKNHIKDQNVALEAKNEELTSIKKQLASDEEECVAPTHLTVSASLARLLTCLPARSLARPFILLPSQHALRYKK